MSASQLIRHLIANSPEGIGAADLERLFGLSRAEALDVLLSAELF